MADSFADRGPWVPRRRPRVLLIVGSGRSGSTLLERALGGVPRVTALGEVVHMWERSVRDDELCACGEHFRECAFWSAVGQRAFGGWGQMDAAELVADRHEVVRTRHVPALLTSSPSRRWHHRREHLTRATTSVLAAAQVEAGARLLVDSSKMPAYAAMLMSGDVDLSCVQVVRDPRGVASSLAKTVARPEVTAGGDFMHRTGVVESALWWSAFDLVTTAMQSIARVPFTTVRYEDFVARPAETVQRVLEFAGLTVAPGDLSHIDGDRIVLGPNHQVAGNPVRFRTGEVTVRPDDAWRRLMRARDRRVVGALTAGLRHRHGYR
jgi:hypothetical protein